MPTLTDRDIIALRVMARRGVAYLSNITTEGWGGCVASPTARRLDRLGLGQIGGSRHHLVHITEAGRVALSAVETAGPHGA